MAGRYSRLDNANEERLPEGVQRIGYDSDRQTYTYRDANNNVYEGEPGNRTGVLHPVARPATTTESVWFSSLNGDDPRNSKAYSKFLFTLIGVSLLVILWLINRGPKIPECGEGFEPYRITKGDTCYRIAEGVGSTVEVLKGANSGLNCDRLQIDGYLCVPLKS